MALKTKIKAIHITESIPCVHNGKCSCKIPQIVQDQCRTRLEGLRQNGS